MCVCARVCVYVCVVIVVSVCVVEDETLWCVTLNFPGFLKTTSTSHTPTCSTRRHHSAMTTTGGGRAGARGRDATNTFSGGEEGGRSHTFLSLEYEHTGRSGSRVGGDSVVKDGLVPSYLYCVQIL